MKKSKKLFFLLPVLLFCSIAPAQNMYMKIKGIPGESPDVQHRDWITLAGYQQGLSSSTASQAGGTARAATGKTSFQDFVIMKKLDKTTPILMQKCATGEMIPEVELEITGADGKTLFRVVLAEVRITGVKSSSDCTPKCETTEEVSFNYAKISWEYMDNKGGNIRAGYDLKLNKKV